MTDQPITLPKRRNWFARHPKTSILLAFILVIAIGLFAFDTIAKRRLAARIDAIRAKGEPVCVDDLKKLRRPGPNSLPDVLAIAPAVSSIKLTDKSSDLQYVGTATRLPTGCRLPQTQIAAARWYLDQAKPQLAAMHDAMRKSRGTLDIQWTTPTTNMMTPLLSDISNLRAMIKAHLLEALYAAETSDAKAAGELLIQHRYFMEAPGDDAPLIAVLVQIASHDMYMDRVERTINRCGIPIVALEAIQNALSSVENMPSLRKMLTIERFYFIENLVPMSGAVANGMLPLGSTMSTSSKMGLGIPGILSMDVAFGLDQFAAYIDASDPNDAAMVAKLRRLQAGHSKLPWYSMLSKVVFPAHDRSVDMWCRALGKKRAMCVAIAAERFRIANNRWPAALDELVPGFLSAVPLDPEDGQPIRYAIIPEGIKAWVITDDDQRIDDGGDIRRLEYWEKDKRPKDHGWLLLNPDLRGRACTPTTTAPSSTTQPRS